MSATNMHPPIEEVDPEREARRAEAETKADALMKRISDLQGDKGGVPDLAEMRRRFSAEMASKKGDSP